MNDEFFITKTVDTGSEGSKVVKFQLYARNCDGEINEISYEELVRLNQFLTEFLKKRRGTMNNRRKIGFQAYYDNTQNPEEDEQKKEQAERQKP